MAQKYYNVADAAKVLGLSSEEVKEMVLRRELYGYRDGADWKFKTEDIDRVAAERGSGGAGDDDNVLASEIELGASDPGLSGTVIGGDRGGAANPDSDIHLAHSDVKLAGGSSLSEFGLHGSDINLAGSAPSAGPKPGDTAAGASSSQFADLDMTLDHDLSLGDSTMAVPSKPAAPAKAIAAKPVQSKAVTDDSSVAIGGMELEDDDLVLGGSGAGSDISIGGDSGISLVDPADSGLSLEAASLNLSKGEESAPNWARTTCSAWLSDRGLGFRLERAKTTSNSRRWKTSPTRGGFRERLASHRLGHRRHEEATKPSIDGFGELAGIDTAR